MGKKRSYELVVESEGAFRAEYGDWPTTATGTVVFDRTVVVRGMRVTWDRKFPAQAKRGLRVSVYVGVYIIVTGMPIDVLERGLLTEETFATAAKDIYGRVETSTTYGGPFRLTFTFECEEVDGFEEVSRG